VPRTIKVGDVYVEVPDDTPLAPAPGEDAARPVKLEKPEEPEPLIVGPRVYRPNDLVQSSFDQIEALGNIGRVHKPWVRKVFFFVLILMPFSLFEMGALNELFTSPPGERLRPFLWYNVAGLLVIWFPAMLWIRAKAASKTAGRERSDGTTH
jgi:hypothetical protein